MRVVRGIQAETLSASAVTIGMFDGVHRGHQALLHACRRHADRLGLPAVALTYEPHPTSILRPDHPVRLLTPLPEKLELLARHAVDVAVVAEFTEEFSRLEPGEYIHLVCDSLHPRVIVAGYRTTFGHHRAGTADVLRALGSDIGFAVEIVPPVEIAGGPVSSSRIRALLGAGDVALAAELLGYPYRLVGEVVPGDQRGRQLGTPTANLQPPTEKLIPADGVYVVEAGVGGATYRGVMNIGARPTFDRPRTLEVHLLDFSGDLYHQSLIVAFLARLRDIVSFPSVEALRAQLQQDIAAARRA